MAAISIAAASAFPAGDARAEEEPIERVSEVLLSPGEAWEEPGFRIQLRAGSESIADFSRVSGGSGVAISAEPGVRLSRWWSVSANLTYTVLGGTMDGLAWSGTADLAFHPWSGLYLAGGAGYAGLLARAMVEDSFAFSCTGSGWAAGLRAGWLFPIGDLFATGPMIETRWMWTRCPTDSDEGSMGSSEWEDVPPMAGHDHMSPSPPAVWRMRTLQLAWSLAWR